MSRRTPNGRHARIPAVSTARGYWRVARAVAVGVFALAFVATLVGLTMRPSGDSGMSPNAGPASPTTRSSGSVVTSNTSPLDTRAESPEAGRNATRSARPDVSVTSPESTGTDDARDGEADSGSGSGASTDGSDGDDRTSSREPAPQTSTRTGSAESPSATESSPEEEREKTSSARTTPSTQTPTPSPSRSEEDCPSPTPTDLRSTVACKIDGLLP